MQSAGVSGNSAGEYLIESTALGSGAIAQILVDVAARHGYTVVAVGPNRYRLARTWRPTWALVAAIVTGLLACVGLLFLLVKRTESGDAVISEGRGGVSLHLVGSFQPAFLEALRNALGTNAAAPGGEAPASAPPAAVPAATPQTAPTPTIDVVPSFGPPDGGHRASPVPATLPTTPAGALDDQHPSAIPLDTVVHRPAAAVLALADGTTIQVGAGGVVGRDPAPDSRLPDGRLYPVADPSLSKTHFSFGPSPVGVWVVDQHSTNGTFLVIAGEHVACVPGVQTEVPFGAAVLAGDLELKVQRR